MSTALPATVNFPVKSKSPGNAAAVSKLKTVPYHFKKTTGLKTDIDTSNNPVDLKSLNGPGRLRRQADLIRDYAKANNYSMEYCFLVDMSIPSGKNRFFVYNMRKDSLEFSALVAHGFGSTQKDCGDQLVFSNNNYSFKTSLGKYKIGKPYKGQYGLSYKLYGLDSTNNKAFERAIVLHSDQHVPEQEIFPGKIFQSAGCPTVSPSFLPILGSFIKSSQKPILMWIYS
ncbi:MAG: murein L,D-transpeptidase catalytic domain family protein [Chitinophagaceae bacterium]|nr:murein L,D-transpeptidase catalytic domain family protein [Chitinophagaceae bacterium]